MHIRRNILNILVLTVAGIFFFQSCATITIGRHRERRGARMVIQKGNGEKIGGELIAVKNKTLLLNISGVDREVDIQDIKTITIRGKSQTQLGGVVGFVAGAALGLSIEFPRAESKSFSEESRTFMIVMQAFGYGALGAMIGIAGAALIPAGETLRIKGISPEKLALTLDTLRKKARFPDYK